MLGRLSATLENWTKAKRVALGRLSCEVLGPPKRLHEESKCFRTGPAHSCSTCCLSLTCLEGPTLRTRRPRALLQVSSMRCSTSFGELAGGPVYANGHHHLLCIVSMLSMTAVRHAAKMLHKCPEFTQRACPETLHTLHVHAQKHRSMCRAQELSEWVRIGNASSHLESIDVVCNVLGPLSS